MITNQELEASNNEFENNTHHENSEPQNENLEIKDSSEESENSNQQIDNESITNEIEEEITNEISEIKSTNEIQSEVKLDETISEDSIEKLDNTNDESSIDSNIDNAYIEKTEIHQNESKEEVVNSENKIDEAKINFEKGTQAESETKVQDKAEISSKNIETLYYIDDNGNLFLKKSQFIDEKKLANVTDSSKEEIIEICKKKFEDLQNQSNSLLEEIKKSEEIVHFKSKVDSLISYIHKTDAIGDFDFLLLPLMDTQKNIEAQHEDHLAHRKQIIYQFESFLKEPIENIKEADSKVDVFYKNWKSFPGLLPHEFSKLQEIFQKLRDEYNEKRRERKHQADLEELNNLDRKLEIIEKAEKIRDNENWKEGHKEMQNLFEEWKKIGHVPRNKTEEIWLKFRNAKEDFYAKKKEHYKEMFKNLDENYILKIALVEKLEELKDSEEWGSTTDKIETLEKEFNSIGHVPEDKAKELLDRYYTAKRYFFKKRNDHYKIQNEEFEKNLLEKKDIVAKVESLQNSTRWNETTREMNILFDKWKNSGRIKKKEDNELWNRFITARKKFFEDKEKYFENLDKKKVGDNIQKLDRLKGLVIELNQNILDDEESLKNVENGFQDLNDRMKAKVKYTIDVLQKKINDSRRKLTDSNKQIEMLENNINKIRESEAKETLEKQNSDENKNDINFSNSDNSIEKTEEKITEPENENLDKKETNEDESARNEIGD